jgi:CDP-diacylglycerol--glycerol-3-phosphate 3-phosphatidyltransferase
MPYTLEKGASRIMKITNVLTLGRIIAAVIFLVVFNIDSLAAKIAALLLLIFAQVSDYFDGHIARTRGQITNFGKLFDPLADCIFFMTLFGCLTIIGYMPAWMFVILLFRELLMTTCLRPYFSYKKIILSAKRSGKVKTIAQGVAANIIMLFLIFNHITDIIPEEIYKMISYWLLFVVVFFSLYSLIGYMRELKKA